VESEASGWKLASLIEEYRSKEKTPPNKDGEMDFEYLFKLTRQNNQTARAVVNHCLHAWSAGIISLIHAYDPEMVILSGGIMKSGAEIIPSIQQNIDNYAWTPWGKVKITAASYANDAVLLGAHEMLKSKIIRP
jgi:glucokinase